MKKILFIDKERLIKTNNNQSEMICFYPKVFQYLARIVLELDFELVVIVKEEKELIEIKNVLPIFENENIVFKEIISLQSVENIAKYKYGNYDLEKSYLIGNQNIEIDLESILFEDWSVVYKMLKTVPRKAAVIRKTNETDISIALNLNGTGQNSISTGLGFFDHMLEQLAKHGNVDLDIKVKGDLEIDEHHTIEDVALALGTTFKDALGAKKGIERYGFLLPMDDCLAQVAIDFGGRPWLVWEADFKREKIGEMPTEMFMHFFKSFSDTAQCNLNIKATGDNEHHKIEAIFKGFAKAIKMAITQTNNYSIPSTKGVL